MKQTTATKESSPWVSVRDGLPADGVDVFVAYRDCITDNIQYAVAWVDEDCLWYSNDDEANCGSVLAWIPIPEYGKEGGNGYYTAHCGACRYFANEDAAGWGWCDLRDESVSCTENCIHGEKRKRVKSPIIEGRLVSDRTFALRLKAFVAEVQANDPMSEEERGYLLGVANRLLAYQAATATDADEIEFLKRNNVKI